MKDILTMIVLPILSFWIGAGLMFFAKMYEKRIDRKYFSPLDDEKEEDSTSVELPATAYVRKQNGIVSISFVYDEKNTHRL